MNELNARLLEYLPDPNTVKGGIGSMVETLQSEAPVLVKEVLNWHFCVELIPCILGVILIVAIPLWVFLFIRKYSVKYRAEMECYCHEDKFALFALFALIPSVALVCANLAWLQIWIAPRLFLLEYIGDLIK